MELGCVYGLFRICNCGENVMDEGTITTWVGIVFLFSMFALVGWLDDQDNRRER